jgi:integrase
VPLVPPAVDALKAAKAAQAADRLAVGEAWVDNGLVFADALGGLLDDRNLRRRYAPLVKAAGLGGSFHALRRSAATQLTAAGVPLGIVAEILGHSSTAITQAHYTVIDTRMMAAALGQLEQHWRAVE